MSPAPHYDPCAVCGEHLDNDELTTRIGEDRAHDACADDPLYVRRCPYCSQLVLIGEDGAWVETSDGLACPPCGAAQAAEIAAETAEEAPASAVPAVGLRPTDVTTLARILREVSS